MKVLLLNGPPRSGKDTAARRILDTRPEITIFDRMSMPIKQAFAGLMSVMIDDYGEISLYEANKERVIPVLGVTYRQWQIDFSEKFMKPLYGQNIFGRLLLLRLQEYADAAEDAQCLVVFPDCGFQIEADTLIAEMPPEDIGLVRITRPGTSFAGDSREFVEPRPGMWYRELENDAGLSDWHNKIDILVNDFLSGATHAANAS